MIKIITIILLCLTWKVYAYEIKIVDVCNVINVKVSNSNIPKEDLELYLRNDIVTHQLGLCISSEKEVYFPCGSRDINDPNFLKNAEINLNLQAKEIVKYEKLLVTLPELETIVSRKVNFMKHSYWVDKTLLEYYKTFDINILKTSYEDLGMPDKIYNPLTLENGEFVPQKFAPKNLNEVFEALENAKTNYEKYNIAEYKWNNAFNSLYHKKRPLPTYEEETQAWEMFIKKHSIEYNTELYEGCEDH